jgi:hypothetical protein
MRNSPQKVGVSFLHDFPVSTLALSTTRFATREEEDRAKKAEAFGCSEERKKFPFAEHFLQNAQNATVL